MPRQIDAPPPGVTRFGLSRADAAFLAGVSVGTFDKMVGEGVMPSPRTFGARKIWLRPEVEQALFALPEVEAAEPNPWDEVG